MIPPPSGHRNRSHPIRYSIGTVVAGRWFDSGVACSNAVRAATNSSRFDWNPSRWHQN